MSIALCKLLKIKQCKIYLDIGSSRVYNGSVSQVMSTLARLSFASLLSRSVLPGEGKALGNAVQQGEQPIPLPNDLTLTLMGRYHGGTRTGMKLRCGQLWPWGQWTQNKRRCTIVLPSVQ
jgi:hypothetical protein